MAFDITPHELIFKVIVRASTVVELFFLVIWHHKKTTLSILPTYFTKHSVAMNLF